MKKLTKGRINRDLFIALMMGPAIIGFLVFYVYVNFDSLFMAFQVEDTLTQEISIGLGNFKLLFSMFTSSVDNVFSTALRNTGIFILFGYFVMLMQLIYAYFLYKKIFMHKFLKFMLYLPAVIMGTATATLFKYIVAYDGPLSLIYQAMGKEMPFFFQEIKWANKALMAHAFIYGFGGMIIYFGAMNQISPEIFESAKLDGVDWVREIFQIILPLIWPTLSMVLLQSVINWPSAGGAVLLFTQGAADTYTLSYWQTERLLKGDQLTLSAALGWIQTLIMFPLAMIVRILLIKADEKIGV